MGGSASPRIPDPCPCGRPLPYAACCGRYHSGVPAPDAESLMRSRYSAYVRGLEGYLLATWHATTRPSALDLAAEPAPKWLGLEVRAQTESGDAATVDFVARFRVGGRGQRLHEVSRFVREDGRWYYLDALQG
ncbi:MAG: SEC-C domain-containing protein [Rhodocyclales bacterium]|nr:SEC-C domain-containing protein [Rhodocyclales bacterium]